MHRRTLLCSLSLLWLLGCVAATPKVVAPPPPPKPPEDPWSWLPEDATTIGHVELTALRKSQLWPLWSELEREQHLTSWVALDKVDELSFGGSGQSRDDLSFVASLEGSFSEGELGELAARDQLAPEQRGLLTVYRRPDAVWTQINSKLIVACTPDRLDALVARASAGPGTPVKQGGLFRSLAERTGLEQAHAAIIAEDSEGKRKDLIERQASRYGLGSIVREAVRLGASLEVGSSYRLVAVAEAADATRAEGLETAVRDKLDALASNFLVRILGVGKLISSLRPSTDGNYVFVRADVAEEELNQLLHRLQGALDLAGGLSSAGPQ